MSNTIIWKGPNGINPLVGKVRRGVEYRVAETVAKKMVAEGKATIKKSLPAGKEKSAAKVEEK